MKSWQKTWREGIEPSLSTTGLEALRTALETDDKRLIQGATTSPPPLHCVQDWPIEACCGVSFAGWQGGEAIETVGAAEEFFAKVCFACDERMSEPAGCRWFLNWFDETPRDEMRAELLAEVQRSLALRYAQQDVSALPAAQ